MSPGEQVKNAIEFAMEHGCYAIGVESVAYQASLLFWIEHFKFDQAFELGYVNFEVAGKLNLVDLQISDQLQLKEKNPKVVEGSLEE